MPRTKSSPSAGAAPAPTRHPEPDNAAREVAPPQDVRTRILETASSLFYERGVRAVGIDLIVEAASVAKASLYRYFPTKDDLIVAFLEREDVDFWTQWDAVAARHASAPAAELKAHMRWIAQRLARSNYRGCPQLNVAAEFAEGDHPARQVSHRHMQSLRRRLRAIAERLGAAKPEELAAQIGVLVNGAFVSAQLLEASEAESVLVRSMAALVAAAPRKR